MRWEVTGADRQTGADRSIVVEAETEDSARRRANRQGLLVSDARAIESDDSVHGEPVVLTEEEPADQIARVVQRPVVRRTMSAPPPMPAPTQQFPVYAQPQVIYVPTPAPVAPPAAPAPVQIVNNVTTVVGQNSPRWSRGTAAILSLFIPGLGQMYKGQVINGVVWFAVVAVGYVFLVLPGVVLHVLCVLGAASGDPYRR